MENLWKNWEKHGKFFEIVDFFWGDVCRWKGIVV